jgi:GEVED domain/Secretion system C-terminal sorting domain
MKKLFTSIFSAIVLFTLGSTAAKAQCTAAQTNWDNLDYYYNSGNNVAPYGYNSGGAKTYVSNALEQTQRFAIGPNSFSIVTSAAGIIKGENATHTGDIAGYIGEDAQFTPSANGQTITITFTTPVLNVNFALYGIDKNAVITVSATDPLAAPIVVNAVPQGVTILTVAGAPFKTIADLTNTTIPDNDNRGTATITVPGTALNPVKTIIITCTAIGGNTNFWLSDINACVTGSFPTNWQQTLNNQPFTGPTQNQPDYFIVTPDNNSVYMMDPVTANVRFLFTDAAKTYVNSFAYDPTNKLLYYISENVSLDRTNKTLKKYDFNTLTTSVVLADVSASLGIATFNGGVESAAAAFYNGQLYFGIEGGQYAAGSTRESMIWRIDFDASQNPLSASQVFSTPSYDAGGNIIHDWADILVKDGNIINYNSAKNGTNYANSSYTHFDMMTGVGTRYNNPTPGQKYSGQAGMNWAGTMYMIYDSLWIYNAGVISSKLKINLVSIPGDPAPPAWVGNAGDGSEPFRPKCDFGDAPATYDPNPISPAVHERSELIQLGTTWDKEWLKRGVTGTNDVDDALPYVSLMLQGPTSSYLTQATVFNNSGANATLIAWLDYNNNGVFDAAEAISPITVPSSASNQLIYLYWPSFPTTLIAGQSTYLRIRITSASAAMTTAHATGYFNNGEVEDYKVNVAVSYPLSVNLLSFDAKTIDNKAVKLNWSSANEAGLIGYEIERSADGSNWNKLEQVFSKGIGQSGTFVYDYDDVNPLKGKSYYRLKMLNRDGTYTYSSVKNLSIKEPVEEVHLFPNPASTKVSVSIKTTEKNSFTIILNDIHGQKIIKQTGILTAGVNDITISNFENLPSGVYTVQIAIGQKIINQKLVKK